MICSVADCQKENHKNYPTRCWTHRGQKWAEPIAEPIAEPVAEPIADEKKEDPELIPAEDKVVETDIAPPTSMSPNATSSSAPIILDGGISDSVKINCKPFFAACKSFLTENAIGKWYETYTMKKKGTETYLHKPMRDMLLLRVEHEEGARAEVKGARRFYWIYNPKDAKAFAEHVAWKLKAECHEVFVSPRTRFFFDIDLVLDETDKGSIAAAMGIPLEEGQIEQFVMDEVSEGLAKVYFEAIAFSLEEHGALDDMSHLDWMATTRNRALDDNGFKISIHLITNLMLSHAACSAIATHVQEHVILENAEPLGILSGSYLLTKSDMFCIEDVDMSNYDMKTVSSFTGVADGDFIKQALSHVDSIPDYSADVFDIEASHMKGSVMFIKRYKPSSCSFCKRTHDNDNTLKIFFNSELGFATWKCIRSKDKSRRFFALEQPVASADDDDIEAFAARKVKPVAVKPVEEAEPVDAKPKRSKPVINMDDADGFQDEHSEGSSSIMDPDAEEGKPEEEAKIDRKLYKLLSCLKPERFAVSAERSPLFGLAVAIRDHSKVAMNSAMATLIKVASEKSGKDQSSSVATAWAWSSQKRARDLTMASIHKFAKSDDPEEYKALKMKKPKDDSSDDETKLLEAIGDEFAKLPKSLIREHNEWTQNSLVLTEEWESPKDIAYAIKSSYAYINNSSQAYYMKKEVKQVRFSDYDVVDVVSYAKHKASSRDCNENVIAFKVKMDDVDDPIFIKLDAILRTHWRQLAYSDAEVIPYSPTETPKIGHTFNMFGDYQHKYDADLEINQELVDLWLHHIRDTICNGDLNCYEYLISWFAHIIQKPKVKTKICPLIKSRPGSGKGFTFSVFNQYVLNPQQTLVVNDLDRLTGRFNSLAIGKMLIVCDEALDSKNRKANQIMKNRISESTQVVEEKYSNPIEVNDFSNYAILTNNDFQSIVEQGDRRYFCLLASDHRGPFNEGSEEYWKMMHEKLLTIDAGRQIFHYLVRRDISNFTISKLPMTDYKRVLKCNQASQGVKYLLHRYSKIVDEARADLNKPETTDVLYQGYREWAEHNGESKTQSKTTFSNWLNDLGIPSQQKKEKIGDRRVSVYYRDVHIENMRVCGMAQYLPDDTDAKPVDPNEELKQRLINMIRSSDVGNLQALLAQMS